jgi:hypothetical protein
MQSPRFESTETVDNDGTRELVLVGEPWACEFSVPPGAVYVVRAKADVPGNLEVEREGDRVTCWAWPGSTAEVWSGERLVDSLDQRVPDVPKGMSVRRFLRLMLGREDTA